MGLIVSFLGVTIFHLALGQDRFAVVNVTIIDGTDHPPRANSTVIVRGKKIVAITTASKKPPRGIRSIDGTGKFLIPSLWNNDLHGPAYGDAKPALERLVSYRITSVRDMGGPLDDVVRRGRDCMRGASRTAFVIAGPLMEGPVPIQMPLIVDLSVRFKRELK